MEPLLRLVSSHNAALTLALLLACAVLGVSVGLQTLRLNRTTRNWRDLMRGAKGTNLEVVLEEHLAERRVLREAVAQLEQRADTLEKKMTGSLRYVGMVRYDAYEDVGATQSWSMAFYDERGNGAVVSCLYGRNDCRVYSKLLDGGKADRNLTGEEQAAIEAAARGARTVVRA
ncbi:MAG: DUF4446 family protein [Fimbriimonadaceae bacterium]|nr:DUF4446 family protein [Fimbriimonadaceae bacterium]